MSVLFVITLALILSTLACPYSGLKRAEFEDQTDPLWTLNSFMCEARITVRLTWSVVHGTTKEKGLWQRPSPRRWLQLLTRVWICTVKVSWLLLSLVSKREWIFWFSFSGSTNSWAIEVRESSPPRCSFFVATYRYRYDLFLFTLDLLALWQITKVASLIPSLPTGWNLFSRY